MALLGLASQSRAEGADPSGATTGAERAAGCAQPFKRADSFQQSRCCQDVQLRKLSTCWALTCHRSPWWCVSPLTRKRPLRSPRLPLQMDLVAGGIQVTRFHYLG